MEPGGAVVATILPELRTATKGDIAAVQADLRSHDRMDRIEAKLDALLARSPA